MKAKRKQSNLTLATSFKNPFDLMQQQQQIIQLKPQPTYNIKPVGKIHTPLPFDPYGQSTTNQFQSKQYKSYNTSTSSYSNLIKENKKQQSYNKNKNGFVNPFGETIYDQEQEAISPQLKGPVAFNPTAESFNNEPKGQYKQSNNFSGQVNEDGDPPLLQDIGINIENIKQRFLRTIRIQKPEYEQLQNADLSGPIIIALMFGCLLLLSGKIHFGDIYAMFLFGNTIMYFLINLMNQSQIIPLYNVMSSLGYSLLPMLILGLFNIFVSLKGTFGILISLSIAIWASLSAGSTMQVYLKRPNTDRKVLLVYPLFLFYLCFAMIVIF